jgi:hypothetical protein
VSSLPANGYKGDPLAGQANRAVLGGRAGLVAGWWQIVLADATGLATLTYRLCVGRGFGAVPIVTRRVLKVRQRQDLSELQECGDCGIRSALTFAQRLELASSLTWISGLGCEINQMQR